MSDHYPLAKIRGIHHRLGNLDVRNWQFTLTQNGGSEEGAGILGEIMTDNGNGLTVEEHIFAEFVPIDDDFGGAEALAEFSSRLLGDVEYLLDLVKMLIGDDLSGSPFPPIIFVDSKGDAYLSSMRNGISSLFRWAGHWQYLRTATPVELIGFYTKSKDTPEELKENYRVLHAEYVKSQEPLI